MLSTEELRAVRLTRAQVLTTRRTYLQKQAQALDEALIIRFADCFDRLFDETASSTSPEARTSTTLSAQGYPSPQMGTAADHGTLAW